MSAAAAGRISSAAGLGATMACLYSAGFHLIPLGGDDGKKPLLRSWHESKRLPLAITEERMRRAGSLTYGVRLDGLMVVDLDTDNDVTRAYFANRFDPSPIIIATGRGSHYYYRYRGPAVSAVREPGIAIDFKAGASAFVVGPGSLRPDGKSYQVLSGDFAVPAPWFVDRGPIHRPQSAAPSVAVGSRHPELLKKSVEYCHCVETFDELLADLMALRDLQFEDAGSVSDDEVVAVARWTWRKRAEGKLYAGRNSEMKVNRSAMDQLLARSDSGDAALLYLLLQSNHGHHPGKVFAIAADAMISADLIKMSRDRVYRARDVLLDECLLLQVRVGKGRHPSLFRLASPMIAAALRERKDMDREGGGRTSITLISPVRHKGQANAPPTSVAHMASDLGVPA
jgi:hypothetical protein